MVIARGYRVLYRSIHRHTLQTEHHMVSTTSVFTNAALKVSVLASGDIHVSDADCHVSLGMTAKEARDLRDKLSAALDAIEPQRVAA